MKDFEEFIYSIDPDTYQTIMLSANQSQATTNRHDSDAKSFTIALELLERYHNWLHEE